MIALSGISLVPGRAAGAVMVVRASASAPTNQRGRSEPDAINHARQAAALELRRRLELLPNGAAREILRAHLALLDDRLLIAEIDGHLQRGLAAEEAVAEAAAALAARFEALAAPTLRARAADLRDVCQCIARHLAGDTAAALPAGRRIVCAVDLSPAQILHLAEMPPLAFVLERGAETSHAAILMRALAVPAVIRVSGMVDAVKDGDQVLVDADCGEVIVHPQRSDAVVSGVPLRPQESDPEPARTLDGIPVSITATIAGAADLRRAIAAGADGVGLFRTEWLFLRERLPSEPEQAEIYNEIAELAGHRPITVRAADLGGDKQPPAMRLPAEPNPALGVRGVRLAFAHPDLLASQVRALVRAFTGRPIRLLLPMVNDSGDVARARAIVFEAAGPQAAGTLELGVMIETPAAALMVEEIAAGVSFLSVGTNDLTQYVLAADREGGAGFYRPHHPAVLRLVRQAVTAAAHRGTPVSVCGEAAADPLLIPLLIAFGVTELSVPPDSVVLTKRAVRRISTATARAHAHEVLALDTAAAVAARLREIHGFPCTRDA